MQLRDAVKGLKAELELEEANHTQTVGMSVGPQLSAMHRYKW